MPVLQEIFHKTDFSLRTDCSRYADSYFKSSWGACFLKQFKISPSALVYHWHHICGLKCVLILEEAFQAWEAKRLL